MSGFIKLDRKILDWEWFSDTCTRDVFIYCLLKANWKDISYKGKVIPKGSFVTTLTQISTDLGFSKQQTRTALSHLQSTHELTLDTSRQNTVITVQNWILYQGDNTQSNTQLTQEERTEQHTTNTPLYKEEYKNLRTVDIECNVQSSETDPEPTVDEAESLFEELWKAYPQKRGKGSISKTTKTKLLKVGREQMLRAIDRYVSECKEQGRYYKNGSTFFNSGYLDYLDDTYTPLDKSLQKGNALDDWTREQKARKAESMKGQQRGTDYDAMLTKDIDGYTQRNRDFIKSHMGGLMEE